MYQGDNQCVCVYACVSVWFVCAFISSALGAATVIRRFWLGPLVPAGLQVYFRNQKVLIFSGVLSSKLSQSLESKGKTDVEREREDLRTELRADQGATAAQTVKGRDGLCFRSGQ